MKTMSSLNWLEKLSLLSPIAFLHELIEWESDDKWDGDPQWRLWLWCQDRRSSQCESFSGALFCAVPPPGCYLTP